ncbi:MAG: trypsin-like peptidase domain-containing protein [Ignavibacteriaceae bacterium]|nr:trypsin-like peptidase domain-containing protein [Ignavibacteriaceae bacterium]
MKYFNQQYFRLVLLPILALFITSCSSVTYEKIYPTLQDGKYDSEFPYKGCSDQLEEISITTRRINSTAFYKTYTFNQSDKLELDEIRSGNILDLAAIEGYADQSSSGTATIIYAGIGRVALLTCAHTVHYPDTIVSYIADAKGNKTEFIDAILIKESQLVYVAGFPGNSQVEILAMDTELDLAIIGRDYGAFSDAIFPVFNYPLGKAKELEWGTFVYVFGYPLSYLMITRAIVSTPNKDESGSFVLDAVVNRGSSGALVLAIKDGVPNFELVGIVQWVPEEEINILIPKKLRNNETYNPIVPYKGELFVKRNSSIRYGIANVISIEAVVDFLGKNKLILNEKKFYFDEFLSE